MNCAGVMPTGRLPLQPSVAMALSFPRLPLRLLPQLHPLLRLHPLLPQPQVQQPLHPLLHQHLFLHHPQPPR